MQELYVSVYISSPWEEIREKYEAHYIKKQEVPNYPILTK